MRKTSRRKLSLDPQVVRNLTVVSGAAPIGSIEVCPPETFPACNPAPSSPDATCGSCRCPSEGNAGSNCYTC